MPSENLPYYHSNHRIIYVVFAIQGNSIPTLSKRRHKFHNKSTILDLYSTFESSSDDVWIILENDNIAAFVEANMSTPYMMALTQTPRLALNFAD